MKRTKTAIYLVISLILCLFIFSSSKGKDSSGKKINDIQKSRSSKNPQYFKRESLPGEEEINLAIGQLENMYEQLENAEDDLDKKSYSPEAVVDEAGREKEALYQWVQEHTILVPYKGSLRGPQGVLMDSLGNSLDRALLLYELLYEADHDVRLARASLPEKKAEDLLHKLRNLSASFSPSTQDENSLVISDKADKFASKYQIDSAELKKEIERHKKEQKRMAKEINERSSKQAAAIISAIERAEAGESSYDESIEIKALQDHWWVQCLEDENWIDLDPSFPDFKLGQTLAEADDYYDPDDLDEDQLHLVHIRFVIEQWDDGKVNEKTILEYTLRPSELLDKRIIVRHYPLDWPTDKSLFEGKDLIQNLKNVILAQKCWIPTLTVASDENEGTMFNDTGELIEKKKRAGGIGAFRQSMFKAFGAEKEKKKTKKDSILTAEWIEYQLCSPGQPSRTIRREIFDLLGPAQRKKEKIPSPDIREGERMARCLSIIGQTEILILTGRISTEFIEYLTIKNLFANRESLIELFTELNEAEPQELLTQLAQINPPPGKLYDIALARSKLGWESRGLFLNHPNIISFHSQLKQNSNGELLKYRSLDIVENDVEVLNEDGFFTRLRQGVLDTNIEASLIAPGYKVYNTSEIFDGGSGWITITEPDKESIENIELDKDTYERIKQDLEEGYIVLAPKRAVRIDGRECIAWWRINPQTGHTLGVGKHGWGQALVDYVELAQTMIQLKLQIESYLGIIDCIMNIAAYALAGEDANASLKLTVGKCIWDTICNYMMGHLTAHFLADKIWSCFIVEKTADWITGSLCGLAID